MSEAHDPDWRDRLAAIFPDWEDSSARSTEWQRASVALAVGARVGGTVICRAPFGAWIDLGIGFPAMAEIIHIHGLVPAEYQAGRWCPTGSLVEGTISAAAEGHVRLVDLTSAS